MCSESSTPPAWFSMVLSLLPHCMNNRMSEWMDVKPPGNPHWIVFYSSLAHNVIAMLSISDHVCGPKLSFIRHYSDSVVPEHLVSPASWPSASGLVKQPQSGMPRWHMSEPHGAARRITPVIYSMVRPLDIRPAKQPQTGFTTWDTLSLHGFTTPTELILRLHERLLDRFGLPRKAAWCYLVKTHGRLRYYHSYFRLMTWRSCAVIADITMNSLQGKSKNSVSSLWTRSQK